MSNSSLPISVSVIAQFCDPYKGCWLDINTPITLDEITDCLNRGEPALTDTEHQIWKPIPSDARERHIRKIAWFVQRTG